MRNRYFNPPNNHPSQPNYLWLEAGTNNLDVDPPHFGGTFRDRRQIQLPPEHQIINDDAAKRAAWERFESGLEQ
jgi:hypothetical protein